MAVFAVYIEKEALYFGVPRRFGNTYHYETSVGQLFDDLAIATAVKNAEVLVTAPSVQFVGYSTWGPTDGTKLANVIRDSGTFDEPGQGGAIAALYAEACALVIWEISRSPTFNRRRWLRKFVRLAAPLGVGLTAGQMRGADAVSPSYVGGMETYADSVARVGQGGTDPLELVTANGDGQAGAADGTVRPFLFTRQIGQ